MSARETDRQRDHELFISLHKHAPLHTEWEETKKYQQKKTPTRIITKIVNEFAHSDLFFSSPWLFE